MPPPCVNFCYLTALRNRFVQLFWSHKRATQSIILFYSNLSNLNKLNVGRHNSVDPSGLTILRASGSDLEYSIYLLTINIPTYHLPTYHLPSYHLPTYPLPSYHRPTYHLYTYLPSTYIPTYIYKPTYHLST